MRRYAIYSLICTILVTTGISGQYGNEWINYDQTYLKFDVWEDGIYRIPYSALVFNGAGGVPGSDFQLFLRGEEVPIYTTTNGTLQNGDYLEFMGYKNRGEFDRELFANADEEQLNPLYSMFTDTAVYFLTWKSGGQHRRISAVENDLSSPPAPEEYYMQKDIVILDTFHLDPRLQDNVSYSHYSEGEGFGSRHRVANNIRFTLSNKYTDGPDALLKVRYATANLVFHDVIITIDSDTLDRFKPQSFGVEIRETLDTLAVAGLSNNTRVRVEDLGINGTCAIGYSELIYPRRHIMAGIRSVAFPRNKANEKEYHVLSGFDHGGVAPIIINLADGTRMQGILQGEELHFVLPPGTGNAEITVAAQSAVRQITALNPVSFTDWSQDDPEYIIITHPFFTEGLNSAGEYMAYRSSEAGGNYDVSYYNILEIYDQFGYGIRTHPEAVVNFARMVRDKWSSAGQVLIIGKAIEYWVRRICETERCRNWLFVPTYGSPGADNLLFRMEGDELPFIPVARIPAVSNEEVLVYLDKVKEHDLVSKLPYSFENRAWTKNLLHLGGGNTQSEQTDIKNALGQMENTIVSSVHGGEVTTFTKTSTDPTDTPTSEQILELMSQGVSVVSFFGHSSSNYLDFQINNPQDWDNQGKYPIFSAMGCNAGQIHGEGRSLSELFIFEPNSGAVAFIAGSGSQYIPPLSLWGRTWYNIFGNQVESVTLGSSILSSLVDFSSSNSFSTEVLKEQQTIAGDPALKFHPSAGRDYLWDGTSGRIAPDRLTSKDSSYQLSIDLLNLGFNIHDSVDVAIEQQFPDNKRDTIYTGKVKVNKYRNSLEFTLPIFEGSTGQNRLFLTVDQYNEVVELPDPEAESNNVLSNGIPLLIFNNAVTAAAPSEFSIVTTTNPVLVASSTDGFSPSQGYLFEMDTTALFDSPALVRHTVQQFGGTVKWQPEYNFKPNTVYYWRVAIDSAGTSQGGIWDSSSFIYSPGDREGWNQSHFYQFEKDNFNGLALENRKLELANVSKHIWVKNQVVLDQSYDATVFIDNRVQGEFFQFFDKDPGNVFVIVVEPVTGTLWKNPPGGMFGAENHTNFVLRVFPFRTDQYEGRRDLILFLENEIPNGHFVILYTYQRYNYLDYYPELWENDQDSLGTDIFSVIEYQYPESHIRSLASSGSLPYAIFYRKNMGVIEEEIAPEYFGTVNVDYNFPFRLTEGKLFSTLIGPASSWSDLQWDYTESANSIDDSITVGIHALSGDQLDTLHSLSHTDNSILLDTIDATEYPYMFLELFSSDEVERTSADVNFWRVYYSGLPDLAFNATEKFDFQDDTISAGAPLSLETVVENIAGGVAENFRVRVTLIDSTNNTEVSFVELQDVPAGQSVPLNFTLQGIKSTGLHRLVIEINPDFERPEKTTFNNLGILEFYVLPDDRNPLLDVTFDGRHIKDREVVSPTPDIEIAVSDDNPFYLITDSTDIRIFLRGTSGFFEEITPDSPLRTFTPAESTGEDERSTAMATFRPVLEDGFYTLQVQARDGSGNTAGDMSYEINFEVISESTVSHLEVYPNPARTFVVFEWTLSGSVLPESFVIEIYDITGRIVDEIRPAVDLYAGDYTIYYDLGSLPAGSYTYKMRYSGNDIRQLYQGVEQPDVGVFVVVR